MNRLILPTALGVVGVLVVAAAFQLLLRYQYVGSGPVMRIDRVTGASCFMPCRPTSPPSAIPAKSPPNYAADDQRAIALAQRQPSAVALEAQYANRGYEWTTEGRYTSDYVLMLDWSKYGGTKPAPTDIFDSNPGGERPQGELPAPIREVCFCSKKGFGWRWEVHLDTREVYEIDGNRDLEKRYGIKTR